MRLPLRIRLIRSTCGGRASCALLVVAFACVEQRSAPGSIPASERTEAAANPSASIPAPTDGDSAAGAARAFVESGLRGERLGRTRCVRRDGITCPAVPVVASFTLDSARVHGDTVRVTARYVEIGSLVQRDAALQFVPRDTLQRNSADTLLLARGAGGWQVVRGDTVPRVLAMLAMHYFDLDEGTREEIARAGRISWSTQTRPVLTSPDSLGQLPRDVRDSLAARGCTVLQTRGDSAKNVVRGAFLGSADGDWAVLCVVHRRDATILIFPRDGGAPRSLETVAGGVPDPDGLPNLESPQALYGCATGIFRVPVSTMKIAVADGEISGEIGAGRLTAAERSTLPHDGLGSGDCEGLSNIYYWTGKRWVLFAGGD